MLNARSVGYRGVAPAFRALVAAATLLGGAWAPFLPARAQSAEEAVAFFMWGLEESSRVKPSATNTWSVEDAYGVRSAFEIKQISQCRYDVHIQRQLANSSDMLLFDYSLDFSAATEYDAWVASSSGRTIIIKIEGTKWYTKRVVKMKDGQVLQTIGDGGVDANLAAGGSVERLRSAFAVFRTNHCRGRGS